MQTMRSGQIGGSLITRMADRRVAGWFVAFLVCLALGAGGAWAQRFETPPLVRFVGTLLPMDEMGEETQLDAQSLVLLVQKRRCLLQLSEVKRLAGRGTGRPVLKGLARRQISVLGPQEVLQVFQEIDAKGQQLTMEGHLYEGTGRLILTTAEVTPSASPEPPVEQPQPATPAGIL